MVPLVLDRVVFNPFTVVPLVFAELIEILEVVVFNYESIVPLYVVVVVFDLYIKF